MSNRAAVLETHNCVVSLNVHIVFVAKPFQEIFNRSKFAKDKIKSWSYCIYDLLAIITSNMLLLLKKVPIPVI